MPHPTIILARISHLIYRLQVNSQSSHTCQNLSIILSMVAGAVQESDSIDNDQLLSPMHFSLHMSTNVAVLQPSTANDSLSANSELKYKPQLGRGDHYLLLSIVLSAACVICLTWWSLPCTLSGLFLSVKVRI